MTNDSSAAPSRWLPRTKLHLRRHYESDSMGGQIVERQFKPVRTPPLASCLCFTLFWAGHAFAIDWPQWRGPNRAAAWTESGIVEKLPTTGLKVLWRAPVAMGYSSPVIASGKVYLSDAELNKP